MMLSLESREANDERFLGEIILYFSDEMSDITWIQAYQMLLQMFRTVLTDTTGSSDEKIDELVEAFMDAQKIREEIVRKFGEIEEKEQVKIL